MGFFIWGKIYFFPKKNATNWKKSCKCWLDLEGHTIRGSAQKDILCITIKWFSNSLKEKLEKTIVQNFVKNNDKFGFVTSGNIGYKTKLKNFKKSKKIKKIAGF